MHPDIPLSLYYSFLILSLVTFAVVVREVQRAIPQRRAYGMGLIIWFLLQYIFGKLGFFALGLGELPPRIMIFIIPNFIVLFYLAMSVTGRRIAGQFSLVFMTAVQVFRIGVELILWQLAGRELLPSVMSFEGRNFDILVGITAPVVAYLYSQGKVSNGFLIAWNVAGLLLVTNVVVHGMLSVPGIELIQTNVPNFIVSFAPFNLLPGVLVPIAYLFHILSIRKLLGK
jgi:hypothetical protein